METTWLRPGENRISFIEENGFHVVFGQRCCNKKGEDVCGDTFSFTNFGRKRAVMLLSDGMGTGKKAFSMPSFFVHRFLHLFAYLPGTPEEKGAVHLTAGT